MPPTIAVATTPIIGNTGSVIRNPNAEIPQPLPDIAPRYDGKIKFPAPKKIANRANPTTNMSFVLFFCIVKTSLFFI